MVARIEALIAGWGLAEALRRAEAYHRAGADAILIHSKLHVPDEILAFLREWQGVCPVVIVPTMYYDTPTHVFEEAGFAGLWGSGLSISAAMGVRDNNEASWTQVLEAVEFMVDAARVTILLDADTGYGNFNNARRLVRKLESRGVAAMCIEDKLFPKTNSFIRGEAQPLAEIQEFAGKIKAAKDTQLDPDF